MWNTAVPYPAGPWRARVVAAAALLAALLACTATPAWAAGPRQVMIVFDGSGSMWGKPLNERAPKLALAREAIRLALPKLVRPTRVGLAAFGHRRSGDCTDVEVLTRPGPVDVDRIVGALDKLNPKGKGPLALALREAAQQLPAAEGGGIVLIHDDADNCQPDFCRAVAEVRDAYPGVTMHVVSIGVKEEDAERMACVARETGGKTYAAQTGAEIVKAIDEALQSASLAAPVPRPQPVSRDMRTKSVAPAAPVKPGVYFGAALTPAGEPLDIPVQWHIARAAEPDAPALYQQEATAPTLELPTGRYNVEIHLGLASARQTIDVDAQAAQEVKMVLNAGTIRLAALAQRGPLPASPPVFTISKPDGGATAAGMGRPAEPLLVIRASQSEIALTPGPYVVSLTHGLYRADRPVIVAAGTRGKLGMLLPTGEVELQAAAGNGGAPLDNVVFQVFEDDPDAPQGRRELVRSSAVRPTFTLPAGTYNVVARRGTAEARERVTVRPGELERRTLALATARLSLAATIAGGRPDSGDAIAYVIERQDGGQKEAVRTGRQTGVFDLAPGQYRIESRIGPLNARAERTIELKPGMHEEITMDHQAGVVRLILMEAGGQTATDVFWEIKDDTQRTVWLTSEAQPVGILQAGRYAVRAEHRDRRLDAAFEVRAGDNRVVEVAAP